MLPRKATFVFKESTSDYLLRPFEIVENCTPAKLC